MPGSAGIVSISLCNQDLSLRSLTKNVVRHPCERVNRFNSASTLSEKLFKADTALIYDTYPRKHFYNCSIDLMASGVPTFQFNNGVTAPAVGMYA
jgi:hypothetical protein